MRQSNLLTKLTVLAQRPRQSGGKDTLFAVYIYCCGDFPVTATQQTNDALQGYLCTNSHYEDCQTRVCGCLKWAEETAVKISGEDTGLINQLIHFGLVTCFVLFAFFQTR